MAYKDKASYESLPPCTVTIASNLWIPMQAFFLVTIQKTQVRNWRIVVEGNDSSTSILGRARRPVQSRWRDCVCLCFFVHYERDFLEPFSSLSRATSAGTGEVLDSTRDTFVACVLDDEQSLSATFTCAVGSTPLSLSLSFCLSVLSSIILRMGERP